MQKVLFLLLLIVSIILLNAGIVKANGDSLNCTLIGRELFEQAQDIFVIDKIAYACTDNSLIVFNMSNPQNPRVMSYCELSDYTVSIFVKDNFAYLAHESNGISIIDISNPLAPIQIGSFDTNDRALNVYVKDTLFLGDGA